MEKEMLDDIMSTVMEIIGFERSDEIKKNAAKHERLFDELKEKLSPEQLNLHNEYVNCVGEDSCEETNFYFAEGFKLGILIGIECKK